jgi:hypothetical protein
MIIFKSGNEFKSGKFNIFDIPLLLQNPKFLMRYDAEVV